MSWWPFGKKDKSSIETSVKHGDDGSTVVTHSMTLTPGSDRPVRDDVVSSMDAAIGGLGGEVMHAMDPRRIVSFDAGGPPIWSVGIVSVQGASNYTLLVTYGFSHVLSPSEFRSGIHHEYSLALPEGINPSPWADALLRHMTRYVLSSGNDLQVGDVMPCYAPVTCVPFQPEHHAMMPPTPLVGLVVADDPVLPEIKTRHGTIQIRRLYGIDQPELDRAETWSGGSFTDEYRKRDPLLLTDLNRSCAMDDPSFVVGCSSRAAEEGSSIPAIQSDVSWLETGGAIEITMPSGAEGAKLRDALRGRLKFGRKLMVVSRRGPPLYFEPADKLGLQVDLQGLVIEGAMNDEGFARYLANPEHTVLRYVLGE